MLFYLLLPLRFSLAQFSGSSFYFPWFTLAAVAPTLLCVALFIPNCSFCQLILSTSLCFAIKRFFCLSLFPFIPLPLSIFIQSHFYLISILHCFPNDGRKKVQTRKYHSTFHKRKVLIVYQIFFRYFIVNFDKVECYKNRMATNTHFISRDTERKRRKDTKWFRFFHSIFSNLRAFDSLSNSHRCVCACIASCACTWRTIHKSLCRSNHKNLYKEIDRFMLAISRCKSTVIELFFFNQKYRCESFQLKVLSMCELNILTINWHTLRSSLYRQHLLSVPNKWGKYGNFHPIDWMRGWTNVREEKNQFNRLRI